MKRENAHPPTDTSVMYGTRKLMAGYVSSRYPQKHQETPASAGI
jgi:hypothetical protein